MSSRGARPPRAPMPRRTRRRWLVAGGVAAGWLLLLYLTGSLVAGTALLLTLAVIGVIGVAGLRALGVGRSHPWVERARSRPWRDGQEVLRLALRHLPEVFVITPGGSLLAPSAVEVRLHPDDFSSLCEAMDIALVNASAADAYAEEAAAHGARFTRPGPPEVWVTGDPSVPRGRYQLRQARPAEADLPGPPGPQLVPAGGPELPAAVPPGVPVPYPGGPRPLPRRAPRAPAGAWPFAQDGDTRNASPSASTVVPPPTVAERRGVPVLRLVTGDCVTQTQQSGARAGRGSVELCLPEVLTISREHARFTYSGGQWWVENLGRNGLTVNGARLEGRRPVGDGDEIRWGSAADAPASRVEIG